MILLFLWTSIKNKKGVIMFIVQGEGLSAEVDKFFYSSSARRKNPLSRGLIAVGRILHGKIIPGEKVEIFLPNGTKMDDCISRVEVNKERRGFASKGEEVGICFTDLRLSDIEKATGQIT